MDSDGELPFSESENQPSPLPERKFKRLRKAAKKASKDLPSPSYDVVPSAHEVNSSGSEALDRGETNTEDFELLGLRSGSQLEVFEQGFKLDADFETEKVRPGTKRHLDFDSFSEEFDGKGEDKLDTEVEEETEDLRTNEGSEQKWRSLDGLEEIGPGAKRHLGFDSFNEEFDGKGEDKLDTEVEEESEDLRTNEGSDKKLRNLDGFEEVEPAPKRHLRFDSSNEEFDGKGEDKLDTEVEEESEDLRKNGGSKKKPRSLDGFEENGEKKRKKRKVKNANDDYDENENLNSDVPTKRMREKERRERLKELRAESQRLLRETREASFKPVPFVQKSVSSVLEKIRQRKQELSKKLVNMTENSYNDDNDIIPREAHKDANKDIEELTSIPVDVEEAQDMQGSKETLNGSHEIEILRMVTADDLKQTFRAPVEDTQDLIFDSPASDSKDEIPSSPLEDFLAPSLTAMNLKFDSALPDDLSDDEKYNDENIDPLRHGSAGLTSSRKGDPVKAFVDDEAEEEDDSDDDRARFQDNEEDEDDIMDSEELNDMIATACEEKPVDNEKRNQLHQKWLEQQDAAGTENLLQRLKCGSKQKETAFMEEQEDEESEEREDEESGEEFDNDLAEGLAPRNIVRMNLKKAKEMIPLMFTDKDDVYVSSDDEETDNTLFKRHLSHKPEEKSTFLSPAEDQSSKDIFGLIKKLNGAPDARRKAKIASYSNTLSLGGNRSASSKLSFLSRGSRNSLPSLQKHGSSKVRSFVFERDDSNSRSAMLTAEDSSDTVQRENRPKKAASAKFSNSQVKSSSQSTQNKAERVSGPSLHEILRCPSIKSSQRTGGNMAGQVEAIYSAFKLGQYPPIKKEPGLFIRTA
ncbi:uncharacterized protein [Euphorbia lathyris]|uniref:uncharacterized protein isoform X2 n=1 Tax=Euphorbia lathyris TaxID=212925 RepID=UPI0033138B7B